jgi:Ca-activated chloride channel family protein
VPQVDVVFLEPAFLWLLVIPALLLALAVTRFVRRRTDIRRLAARRIVPVRQRFGVTGDVPFWMFLALASAALIVAVARPSAPTTAFRRAGIDVVVLQDASASMRVRDVPGGGDRWRRSMRFLRRLGDSLSWREDRVALAAFAHIAAPQVRLTNDPNTLFFFLDHLEDRPPFRIEDATTWDTNLELGVYWGLRLIEKDEELHGRRPNARLFVMLSDGEAWSGEVARALELATARGIPLFVIGVGTLGGGRMPVVPELDEGTPPEEMPPLVSRLDRAALQRLAAAGRGRYFELDRQPDRDIANAIIDAGRRLAPAVGTIEEQSDLYWFALLSSAAFVGLAVLFLRDWAALTILLSGAAISAAVLSGTLL